MADETNTGGEPEDLLDIVEVDHSGNPLPPEPTEGETPPAAETPAAAAAPEEDLRLAEEDEEDDIGDGTAEEKQSRRRERRRRQREARERDAHALALMREQNAAMALRLSQLESHAIGSNVASVDQRIRQAARDAQLAEQIIAKAVEAGNGEDVAQAMRIRDQALGELSQLQGTKQQLETTRDQVMRQATEPRIDPRVSSNAQQWQQANPWYNHGGTDRDSMLTKAIDAEIAAEGFDPASMDYWVELTRRVGDALGANEAPAQRQQTRRGPPVGGSGTREHNGAVGSRNEVRVTPEQKQAMVEAGIWDDPIRRNRVLRAYQAQGRASAR